ncbi:MAG: hypothetical protein ACUVXF_05320 [Desulfobaccales bacterium]
MLKNIGRMTTRVLALGLAGWLLAGLLGCCGKHTKRNYGRAVTHNLASQLVNPEAGQQVQVSVGQSPEAALNAYEKYNKSFRPEEKKPMLKLTTEEK